MARPTTVPPTLAHRPFLAKVAVERGLLSRRQLQGPAWVRMETRLRLVVVGGGLPRPVAQFPVSDKAGRFIARLDLAYPRQRVGLEYEGDHHRGRARFQADLRRCNRLRDAGWTVFRYGPRDVFDRPDSIVAETSRALGL